MAAAGTVAIEHIREKRVTLSQENWSQSRICGQFTRFLPANLMGNTTLTPICRFLSAFPASTCLLDAAGQNCPAILPAIYQW